MQISLPFEAITVKSKKNSYRNKRLQLYRRLRLVAKIFLVLLVFVALSALCLVGYRALLSSPLLQVTRIQVNGLTVIRDNQVRIPWLANKACALNAVDKSQQSLHATSPD